MTAQKRLVIKLAQPCWHLVFFQICKHSFFTLLFFLSSDYFLQAQENHSATDRVIVKFSAQASFIKRTILMQENRANLYKNLPQTGYHILKPAPSANIPFESWLEKLRAQPEVEWAEVDLMYTATALPNDPDLNKQWGLENTGQQGGIATADISASGAWDIEIGSKALVIAIIDGGIDWTHPDLVENIWQNSGEDLDGDGVLVYQNGRWQFDPDDINGIDNDGNGYPDDFIGWDFANNDNNPYDDTQYGHGTHVGGIIAAKGNNSIGVSGVSWNASLMPLKFLNANSHGYVSDAIEALGYATQMGARISSNSWGGFGFSQALYEAIARAQLDNHLVIAAAGNHGANTDLSPLYPASFDLDNIISVSASDPSDQLAVFSNYGANTVDIAAPGVDIYSTLPNGKYGYASGTSMAAPFVSGAMSLLLAQNNGLSYLELKQRMLSNVDYPSLLAGKSTSSGRLNIEKALLEEGEAKDCEPEARFSLEDYVSCPDEKIKFEDKSKNADHRKWLINGNEVSSEEDFEYKFQQAGVYTVTLIAWKKGKDCKSEITRYVTIIGQPDLDLKDIEECREAITVNVEVEAMSYVWEDEDEHEISRTPKVNISKSGKYTLIVTDGCGKEKKEDFEVELTGDCVWPGDVNADGEINSIDFLMLGMAYGTSGNARPNASADYSAQEAPADWTTYFPSNSWGKLINHKHADCNGDGLVNLQDAQVIRANANDNCEIGIPATSTPYSLTLALDQQTLQLGDNLTFDIVLDNSANNESIEDVYGIAFTIDYNVPFRDVPVFSAQDSWLGTSGQDMAVFTLSTNFEGSYSQALKCSRTIFTRLDQESVSGLGGTLGRSIVTITIDDVDIYRVLYEGLELSVRISEAILLKGDGSLVSIGNLNAQSWRRILLKGRELERSILTNLYPNPTDGVFTLEIQAPKNLQNEILITNLLGELVYVEKVKLTKGVNVVHFSLADLSKGMYLLQLKDKMGSDMDTKKLVIK